MRAIVVIPARHESTRLPGKPLVLLGGTPMILRVLRNARRAVTVDRVIVATDDDRIATVVRADGGEVAMTPSSCVSGSDRVALAARSLDADLIVNVQGDEPLLHPAVIDALVECARSESSQVVTAMTPIRREAAEAPSVVKVVTDRSGHALYFSRALIPFVRKPQSSEWFHRHLGVYCYTKEFLEIFSSLPTTRLEENESLEQLRLLECGHRIRVVETEHDSIGVDTMEDVHAVQDRLRRYDENDSVR